MAVTGSLLSLAAGPAGIAERVPRRWRFGRFLGDGERDRQIKAVAQPQVNCAVRFHDPCMAALRESELAKTSRHQMGFHRFSDRLDPGGPNDIDRAGGIDDREQAQCLMRFKPDPAREEHAHAIGGGLNR